MTLNFISEIMLGIGIGLGAGFGYVLYIGGKYQKQLIKNSELHKANLYTEFRDSRQIQLDRIVEKTNCANAIVLKISNGGGELKEGVPWYSSIVAESPEVKEVSAIDDWQYRSVKDDYKALIRRVQRDKYCYITTESMPHGDLRMAYEAMGIVGSVVAELYRDDFYYYYLSFPVRERWINFMNSPDQHAIKSFNEALKRKYFKFSKLGILEFDNLN